MKVYWHRAGNDLKKLPRLEELGIKTVEGDVMACWAGSDRSAGSSVLVHPEGLPRRTCSEHLDYTVDEVKQVMAAKGIQTPDLLSGLRAVAEAGARLLLESKIPRTFADIGRKVFHPHRDRLILISFMGEELIWAKMAGFRTGFLIQHNLTHNLVHAFKDEYDPAMLMPNLWYISKDMVKAAHDLGLEVVAWTVNDVGNAHRMQDLGVDAILSDLPELFLNLPGFEPG